MFNVIIISALTVLCSVSGLYGKTGIEDMGVKIGAVKENVYINRKDDKDSDVSKVRKEKKLKITFSTGISLSKPKELFYRLSGINSMILQYSDNYGLKSSSSGVFKENFIGIPLIASISYPFKKGLRFKAGLEYSTMENSSSKLYNLNWTTTTERFEYKIKNRISGIMPFIGVEKWFSAFSVYLSAGLNFVNIRHSNKMNYSEGSYSLNSSDDYSLKGRGLGIILGGKYRLRLGKKNELIFKVEYVSSRIGSWSGTKTTESSDISGKSFSDVTTGTVYIYDYNPFGINWFKWWDVYQNIPEGNEVKNVTGFSLDLSKLRLVIGFSF